MNTNHEKELALIDKVLSAEKILRAADDKIHHLHYFRIHGGVWGIEFSFHVWEQNDELTDRVLFHANLDDNISKAEEKFREALSYYKEKLKDYPKTDGLVKKIEGLV